MSRRRVSRSMAVVLVVASILGLMPAAGGLASASGGGQVQTVG